MFSKFGVTPLLTTNGWTLLNHQILGGSRWQWNGHALLENGLTLNYTMNINESGDIFQPESHVFIPQISTTSNLTIWMAQGISSWFPIQISLLAGQWSGHPGPWVRRPKCHFLQRHWLLINPRHLGWAATVALVALAFPKWENHHKWWKKTCSSLVSNGRIPFWGWISGGDQWRILHSDPYVLPTPNRYVATCSFLLFRCSEPLIAVPQVRQSHPMIFYQRHPHDFGMVMSWLGSEFTQKKQQIPGLPGGWFQFRSWYPAW